MLESEWMLIRLRAGVGEGVRLRRASFPRQQVLGDGVLGDDNFAPAQTNA